jgi:hypothetical protein
MDFDAAVARVKAAYPLYGAVRAVGTRGGGRPPRVFTRVPRRQDMWRDILLWAVGTAILEAGTEQWFGFLFKMQAGIESRFIIAASYDDRTRTCSLRVQRRKSRRKLDIEIGVV